MAIAGVAANLNEPRADALNRSRVHWFGVLRIGSVRTPKNSLQILSAQQSRELADWVAESGKNLVMSYVTHAHGDHFFGLKLLLDRFP